MPTGTRRVLLFGNRRQEYSEKILYLDFTTASGPPIANPYVGNIGQVTTVQTDGQFTVAGGVLSFPAQVTPVVGDQGFYGAAMARVAGRTLQFKFRESASLYTVFGWNRTNNSHTNADENFFFDILIKCSYSFSDNPGSTGYAFALNTDYEMAVMLRATGAFFFAKGGVFTDWQLLWCANQNTTATLYPFFDNYQGVGSIDYFFVRDYYGAFITDFGIYMLNQASPVSSTNYIGNADGIFDLTVTAPASLGGDTAELRYRVQDANNYWTAYFDASGNFRLDSVAAGVATNRISVAGVIVGSGTRTIRVIANGSNHDCFTKSGATWTKRGATVTVSHLNTLTTLQPVVTAGYSMTNLQSVPRTSSQYSVLGAP